MTVELRPRPNNIVEYHYESSIPFLLVVLFGYILEL